MSWIRPTEYQNIKYNLRDYSVKQTAVYFDRAIGTIYQIKNTKNHEEYCRRYSKRQFNSLYGGIKKVEKEKKQEEIIDRLDRIERQLNALAYIWEK